MSEKTSADVLIGGKVYTLSGYEGEAYYQKVASYINNKMSELEAVEAFKRLSLEMKTIMMYLNIADDYFKAKALLEKLEKDIETKDKELYELKHDLVSSQIKTENSDSALKDLEKEKKDLEKENKDLWVEIARLEAALENAQK